MSMMDFKHFSLYMQRLGVLLKNTGGPDTSNDSELRVWYDALKMIPEEGFLEACLHIRDTFTRHPTIADFKILTGTAPVSDDDEALKAAEKVLQAASNQSKQNRVALGELAYAVSNEINGFWDLGMLNLNDGYTLNAQKRRLQSIALDIIKEKRQQGIEITKAQTPTFEIPAPKASGSPAQDGSKCPPSSSLKELLAGLKSRINTQVEGMPDMGSKEWLEWWAKEREAHIAKEFGDKRYAHKDAVTGELVWHAPCDANGVKYRAYDCGRPPTS